MGRKRVVRLTTLGVQTDSEWQLRHKPNTRKSGEGVSHVESDQGPLGQTVRAGVHPRHPEFRCLHQ